MLISIVWLSFLIVFNHVFISLVNYSVVFIRLVLSEDLGSANLRHQLYMYIYAKCDLVMILLLMLLIDMR